MDFLYAQIYFESEACHFSETMAYLTCCLLFYTFYFILFYRFASACSAANLSPVIKKRNLIAGNGSRPGDIFLPSWESGRPAALEVTVTSPLHSNIINHAAEKSGYATEAAEERKYAQHEKNCSEQGFLFVPLAVESLGGLSVTLKKALKRIILLADSRNYQSQGHAIAFDRLAQSISVVIVRGSATMLLARVP